MITILLAAVLAAQQPGLRDVAAVNQLLASLRTADPTVCEMAGRTLTNHWGWGGDFSDEAMPSPMPMPVPMPMPFAGRGQGIAGPSVGRHAGKAIDEKVLAIFRTALRDQSWCVRRIAARLVAQEEPSWALSEFNALAKDAEPGFREVGLLGLGELEDPRSIDTMANALGDRDVNVRAMAAWALGQVEDIRAITPLAKALGDDSPLVRRRASWALGEI